MPGAEGGRVEDHRLAWHPVGEPAPVRADAPPSRIPGGVARAIRLPQVERSRRSPAWPTACAWGRSSSHQTEWRAPTLSEWPQNPYVTKRRCRPAGGAPAKRAGPGRRGGSGGRDAHRAEQRGDDVQGRHAAGPIRGRDAGPPREQRYLHLGRAVNVLPVPPSILSGTVVPPARSPRRRRPRRGPPSPPRALSPMPWYSMPSEHAATALVVVADARADTRTRLVHADARATAQLVNSRRGGRRRVRARTRSRAAAALVRIACGRGGSARAVDRAGSPRPAPRSGRTRGNARPRVVSHE